MSSTVPFHHVFHHIFAKCALLQESKWRADERLQALGVEAESLSAELQLAQAEVQLQVRVLQVTCCIS